MYVSNATGCSSIWGGPGATSPYTTNKDGLGPAWANSLFEDNSECGFGINMAQKTLRDRLIGKVEALSETASGKLKEACENYLATKDSSKDNKPATDALIIALENAGVGEDILADKEFLNKKSVWIFGGDGWAYDIGYGGLDHVIASGEDVNILVFDTEVYSNTGGQSSKSTPTGAVAQFAAGGKEVKKKDLAQIAMSYGYVYVAQIAMGADYNQCIKALTEAEAYHGPSIIIAYAPCINHGIKGGMSKSQTEEKNAVASGYWNCFRYNPAAKAEGKNPLTVDSKAPTASYQDFIMNEVRYNALSRQNPEKAKVLFEKAEKDSMARFEHLKDLEKLYDAE